MPKGEIVIPVKLPPFLNFLRFFDIFGPHQRQQNKQKVCLKGMGSYKEYLKCNRERSITILGRRKKAERLTPEGRESYMMSLAMDQAEEMLEEHRAPQSVLIHFLKLATTKAQVELEKLKAETDLTSNKADLVESQRKSDEVAEKALAAFKTYAGINDTESEYDDEDDEYYD